jgi:hypothetical protein
MRQRPPCIQHTSLRPHVPPQLSLMRSSVQPDHHIRLPNDAMDHHLTSGAYCTCHGPLRIRIPSTTPPLAEPSHIHSASQRTTPHTSSMAQHTSIPPVMQVSRNPHKLAYMCISQGTMPQRRHALIPQVTPPRSTHTQPPTLRHAKLPAISPSHACKRHAQWTTAAIRIHTQHGPPSPYLSPTPYLQRPACGSSRQRPCSNLVPQTDVAEGVQVRLGELHTHAHTHIAKLVKPNSIHQTDARHTCGRIVSHHCFTPR